MPTCTVNVCTIANVMAILKGDLSFLEANVSYIKSESYTYHKSNQEQLRKIHQSLYKSFKNLPVLVECFNHKATEFILALVSSCNTMRGVLQITKTGALGSNWDP